MGIKLGDKVSYDYEGGFFHSPKRKRSSVVRISKGKQYPANGTFTDERGAQYRISNITKIS